MVGSLSLYIISLEGAGREGELAREQPIESSREEANATATTQHTSY
jgi:hypothetical protein